MSRARATIGRRAVRGHVRRALEIRLADNAAFSMAGAKIVGDFVTLDAEHAKTASCQLRCDRASHPPETDDDDVVSLGRLATAGHGTISVASSDDLA